MHHVLLRITMDPRLHAKLLTALGTTGHAKTIDYEQLLRLIKI